jgi:hypothetical protein
MSLWRALIRLLRMRPPRPFRVVGLSRDVWLYTEGDLRVSIAAELMGKGPPHRVLYPRTMRVYPPGGPISGPGAPLTDEGLRDRIIANILSDAPPGYYGVDYEWGAAAPDGASASEDRPRDGSPSIEPVYLAPQPVARHTALQRLAQFGLIAIVLLSLVALLLKIAALWRT